MRTASAALLACLLAACTDVVIEPRPGGGAGGEPPTTSSLSGAGGAGAGPSEGGAESGGAGAGGAPVAMPVCASPDTFDSGVLDESQWSAFPVDAFSLVDGGIDLHSDLAYLKLHAQPVECAFTFEIVSLSTGRVSLQIVGEADALIDVRLENGAASAVRWDPVTSAGEEFESPVPGMPLGLGLLFFDGQISCVARYESGWHLIATFPTPEWLDIEEPEVRFVDIIGGGSARIDDYGIEPVVAVIQQMP